MSLFRIILCLMFILMDTCWACAQTTLLSLINLLVSFVLVCSWFELEKENGPRTVKEVKLISAGKVLDNNKTVKDYRSPVSTLVDAVTTMHVIIQPLLTEKGIQREQSLYLSFKTLFSTWQLFLFIYVWEQKRSLKMVIPRWTNVSVQSCKSVFQICGLLLDCLSIQIHDQKSCWTFLL